MAGKANLGESNGRAKLNEKLVREIRDKYAVGMTVRSLMDTYGMSIRAIEGVVHRRTWRHVDS